jgi:hypothetical protein
MTDKYNTEINEILLQSCHHYMLLTGESPAEFVSNLYGESNLLHKTVGSKLKKDLKKLHNGDKSFWQRLGIAS